MKSVFKQIPTAILVLSLISCGPTLKVSSDYDRAQTFSNFKTFALYQSDSSMTALSQLNKERILAAVKAEMTKKGFTENTSSPDLWVNAVAIVKDKIALSSTTDYYGYGGVYRPYAWGGTLGVTANTTYNADTYKDGSLIIDIVDASTKKVVWVGTGSSEIDKPLKNPDEEIPAAVTKIMASFPPGATGTK